MKKFTSLFALLAVALSVLAQPYQPTIPTNETTIFFEKEISPYLYIYVYGGYGELAGKWPGTLISDLPNESINGHLVYRWTCDANKAGEKIIFHKDDSNDNRIEQDFHDKGIYIDGVFDRLAGENVDAHYVYFDTSERDWWNDHDVYVYAWSQNHNAAYLAWPGVKMERIGSTNLYKGTIYSDNFKNIRFNWNKQGGNSVTGEDETSTLTEEDDIVYTVSGKAGPASLVVTDGSNFSCAKNYTAVEASYSRTISDNWGTLCLPFAITKAPDGVTFYTLSSVDTERKVLSFTATNSVEAGMPVVFKASGSDLNIKEGVVPVSATTKTSSIVEGWELKGSFARMDNYTPSGTMYFFSENQFWSGTPAYIPAYRAWFDANVNFGANAAPFRIEADDTEDIQFVEQEDGTVKAYYDLQGRKLDGARKGLVIENGKIIMVK